MANENLNNFKQSILQQPKQRNIFLSVSVLAVVMIGGSYLYINSKKNVQTVQSSSTVAQVPNINVIPASSGSQQYNNEVQKANDVAAQQALQNGTSFIPTPTNSNIQESEIEKIERQQKEKAEKEKAELEEKERDRLAKEEAEKMRLSKLEEEKIRLQNQKQEQQLTQNTRQVSGQYNENDLATVKTLLGIWSIKSANVETNYNDKSQIRTNASESTSVATNATTVNQGTEKVISKAGEILNAVLETNINSDEPSPVLAKVVGGPYNGTRFIGDISRVGGKVLITFKNSNFKQYSKSVKVNAVAIDPSSQRTALATDVDNHYFLKYGVLLGAAFLSGYADAIVAQGTTTTTNTLGGSTTVTGVLSEAEITKKAVGGVGKELAGQVKSSVQNIQPTITVNAGTAIGILMMDDLIIKE